MQRGVSTSPIRPEHSSPYNISGVFFNFASSVERAYPMGHFFQFRLFVLCSFFPRPLRSPLFRTKGMKLQGSWGVHCLLLHFLTSFPISSTRSRASSRLFPLYRFTSNFSGGYSLRLVFRASKSRVIVHSRSVQGRRLVSVPVRVRQLVGKGLRLYFTISPRVRRSLVFSAS